MSDTIKDLKKELNDLQHEVNLLQKASCSKEAIEKYIEMLKQGQSLPEGVYRYKGFFDEELNEFYTIKKADELNKDERLEYILLKQYQLLKTIKNSVLFFVALTVLFIILTLMGAFQLY